MTRKSFCGILATGCIAIPLFAAVFGYNLLRIMGEPLRLAKLRNKLLPVVVIAWSFHAIVISHSV